MKHKKLISDNYVPKFRVFRFKFNIISEPLKMIFMNALGAQFFN